MRYHTSTSEDTPRATYLLPLQTDYAEHRLKGLPDSTPQSFFHWSERLESLAASLPASRFKDQSVL
eukprot:4999900-Prymnesium_polylepis.1